MRRTAAVALLASALAVGCGRGGGSEDTITVAGEKVAVAPLVDAHTALCQAAARPVPEVRVLFFDRSHDALHTVARALEDVDRAQAAQLLVAKEKVESELGGSSGGLPDDLSRLADVYRASLGRLAITAVPCEK